MKVLLLVTTANDIFIYNMVKWLKKSIDNIIIDVFEFYPSLKQGYDFALYDHVITGDMNVWYCKIKGLRGIFYPFKISKMLKSHLKNNYYDIIHCHYMAPHWILGGNLKKYCSNLCVTFWGGEYETQSILLSKKIYKYKLRKFLDNVDWMVNSDQFISNFKRNNFYPNLKYQTASLGSASLDLLYSVCADRTKNESKDFWEIPVDKKSVLIGYSGKRIHNHLDIIKEISKNNDLKDKIHLLVPMTRGADALYIQQVESALKESGLTYTLLKDRFLSDREIAELRNATDIVLQMSQYDGYSRSIVECLSSGAVLIYGDWLNYDKSLKYDGFYSIKVKNIADGVGMLSSIISDYNKYYQCADKCKNNGKKYIWSECIKNWANLYKNICSNS